jgi:hypothetical protein
MSFTKKSLEMLGLFEAEVLLELMLRYWKHPLADDEEFRNDLLESAAEVLRASLEGERLIAALPPDQMNLIAAYWYAENSQLPTTRTVDDEILSRRIEWVKQVEKSLPSCFCPPDRLF